MYCKSSVTIYLKKSLPGKFFLVVVKICTMRFICSNLFFVFFVCWEQTIKHTLSRVGGCRGVSQCPALCPMNCVFLEKSITAYPPLAPHYYTVFIYTLLPYLGIIESDTLSREYDIAF